MRKILFALLTAATLWGCDKGDDPPANQLVTDVVMPSASTVFGAGDEVTIKGKGFTDADVIFFHVPTRATTEVTATVTSVTSEHIKFTLPSGLPEGDNMVWMSRDGEEAQLGKIKVEESTIPTDIETVNIPAGAFMMGSAAGEPESNIDQTQHSVTLTKAFRMSKYEITNAQFAAFLNANHVGSDGKWPSGNYPTEGLIYNSRDKHEGRYDWGLNWDSDNNKWAVSNANSTDYSNYPVIWVTWFGASEFARWVGGALPTEAQWEYACRGDYPNKATETATKPFGLGDGTKLDYTLANFWWEYSYALPGGMYTDNANIYPKKTQPVGSYAPNNYGLYDMHGNVFEWCSDWYSSSYGTGAVTNPTGPATGLARVARGGSWYRGANYCRSAYRMSGAPVEAPINGGFRVVFNQ